MEETERNKRGSATAAREEYLALLSAASATAGKDDWKTCAGRLDGPDHFIPSDLYNCMKRSFKRHVKSAQKRSRCPVCMEDPSAEAQNGWYITKSCNHAVCRDCLKSYASSQIADPNHSGPLKCPCCPRLLRVEDAKVALSDAAFEDWSYGKHKHNESTLFREPDQDISNALANLKKWDAKCRDGFLRSMPDFRPCPHCSKEKTSSELNGGGFVTPECLSPINEERESYAEGIISFAGPTTVQAVLLAYAMYYVFCSQRYSVDSHPLSRVAVFVQIITAILPGVLVPVLPHIIRLFLAKLAKEAIVKPIIVTCPCCNNEFNLEASSEFNLAETLTSSASEAATQSWKNTNTRPCPGCSSPVLKDGGCNHMKCGKCRVTFCWACMRCKSQCKAYQCKNGAPFGNAFGDGSLNAVVAGLAAGERQGRTLMEHIEAIESEARRNLQRSIITGNAAKMIGIYAISNLFVDSSRYSDILVSLVYCLARCAVAFIVAALLMLCIVRIYWIGFTHQPFMSDFRQDPTTQSRSVGGHRESLRQSNGQRNGIAGFDFRTEEEMISEAIARSLAEQ
ncbi:hypothetical protein ACHAWO_001685 [Cyclotella atomus]|uniref:RING-type domain-containing protein n=1 Tax=Cyclotella atomus TaxID=382360 RepID=A0ABD3Q1W2_9STRA